MTLLHCCTEHYAPRCCFLFRFVGQIYSNLSCVISILIIKFIADSICNQGTKLCISPCMSCMGCSKRALESLIYCTLYIQMKWRVDLRCTCMNKNLVILGIHMSESGRTMNHLELLTPIIHYIIVYLMPVGCNHNSIMIIIENRSLSHWKRSIWISIAFSPFENQQKMTTYCEQSSVFVQKWNSLVQICFILNMKLRNFNRFRCFLCIFVWKMCAVLFIMCSHLHSIGECQTFETGRLEERFATECIIRTRKLAYQCRLNGYALETGGVELLRFRRINLDFRGRFQQFYNWLDKRPDLCGFKCWGSINRMHLEHLFQIQSKNAEQCGRHCKQNDASMALLSICHVRLFEE